MQGFSKEKTEFQLFMKMDYLGYFMAFWNIKFLVATLRVGLDWPYIYLYVISVKIVMKVKYYNIKQKK